MKTRALAVSFAFAAASLLLPGVPYAQDQKSYNAEEYRAQLKKEVPETIADFKKTDPSIERFFTNSAGYAVFPRIGKAGFIVGGGHGAGEVHSKGNKVLGVATMNLVTVGLQAGAQEFSQIMFFETQAALDRFMQGKFEFGASASAVILTTGASKAKEYRDGVAVFVKSRGGAMAEAALGTQKFSFKAEGGDSMKK